MAQNWRLAVAVLRDALRFFFRNYLVIAAFGVLASIQRFLAVGGGERFSWAGGPAGEIFTALTRVALIVWIAWVLLRGVRWSTAAVRRFFAEHAGMLLISAAFLIGLTVVFKIIPDAIGGNLDESAQSTWFAWELAIKNVTIIPFMSVWAVQTLRTMLLTDEPAVSQR